MNGQHQKMYMIRSTKSLNSISILVQWGGVWDGLYINWGSRTFCNPPYSQIKYWIRKAWEESQLGKTVVLLIPSRTDTRWWHEYVMKGEIRFIRGRLRFGSAKFNAPFPSAIVIFKGAK